MVGINSFPRMLESHSRLRDQASMMREASEKALETLENGKNAPKGYLREVLQATAALATRVMDEPRLQEILNAVIKLSADSYSRDYQVKNMIKDLSKRSQPIETPRPTTYAQAVGRDPLINQDTTTRVSEQKEQRTIRIKMNNPQVSVENKRSSPKELVSKVNKAIQDLSISQTGIGAAKTLQFTGDVEITAASREEAEKLRKDQRWTQALATTAQVKERTFGVIAKGVAVQDLRGDQGSMRAQIREQNQNAMEVDPYWVGYLHKPREGESRIPLIIEVKGVHQANRLIRDGICIGAVWYRCEVYNRRCRLTQCFKCWRYGHLATVCPHEERCGKCGKGHNHLSCASVRAECAGCGGEHEARSRLCTSRAREVDRIERIRKTTPSLFPIGIQTKVDNLPIPTRRVISSGDEWQEVSTKGKKRKVMTAPRDPIPAPQPSTSIPIEKETQANGDIHTDREGKIQWNTYTQTNGDTQPIRDPQEDMSEEW